MDNKHVKSNLIRRFLADGEKMENSFQWIYKFHLFMLELINKNKITISLEKVNTENVSSIEFPNARDLNNRMSTAFCDIINAYYLFWNEDYDNHDDAENTKAIYQNTIVVYFSILDDIVLSDKKSKRRYNTLINDAKKKMNGYFMNFDLLMKSSNFFDIISHAIMNGFFYILVNLIVLFIGVANATKIHEFLVPLYPDFLIKIFVASKNIYGYVFIGVLCMVLLLVLYVIKICVKKFCMKRHISLIPQIKLSYYKSQNQKQLYYASLFSIMAIVITLLVAYIQTVINFL